MVQFIVRLAHFNEEIWTNFNTSVFEGYQTTCTQMFFIWCQPIDCSQSSHLNGFHLLLQVLRQTSMPYGAGIFYYWSYEAGVSVYKVFSIGASIFFKSLRKNSRLFAFRTISPMCAFHFRLSLRMTPRIYFLFYMLNFCTIYVDCCEIFKYVQPMHRVHMASWKAWNLCLAT